MLKIEITADNVIQLEEHLASLGFVRAAAPALVEAPVAVEAPKKPKAPKAPLALVEATPEPVVEAAPLAEVEATPEPEAAPTAKAVTHADIKTLATTLIGQNKQPEVQALVKEYATVISKIPEDKLIEVYARLEALK